MTSKRTAVKRPEEASYLDVVVTRLTKRQLSICRKIATEDGPVGVYARLAIACHNKSGVRLTFDDVLKLLIQDDAVSMAIQSAIIDDIEGDTPTPPRSRT